MKRTARNISIFLFVALAIPALAQVTDEDIDEARSEVNRILAESQELGDAIQETWARQAELESEIVELEGSIDHARIQLAELRKRMEEVAVQMYMGSTSGASLSAFLAAGEGAGLKYLEEVSGVDSEVINQLRVLRRELDHQTDRLAEASAEEQVLAAQLEEMASGLQEELIAAQAVYDQLIEQQRREEEERRRQEEEMRRRAAEEAARLATSTTTVAVVAPTATTTVSSPTTTAAPPTTTTEAPAADPAPTGGTCPVAGAVSFTDTWGDPRSGGRTHKGVDMIAVRGTPTVAIYSGTVARLSTSTLGGISIYFRSDAGDIYYYAHLDGYGEISAGQHVDQGHVVGYVGSTGNAPAWLPHLHFEYHPGGGAAVNPYPLVKRLCG